MQKMFSVPGEEAAFQVLSCSSLIIVMLFLKLCVSHAVLQHVNAGGDGDQIQVDLPVLFWYTVEFLTFASCSSSTLFFTELCCIGAGSPRAKVCFRGRLPEFFHTGVRINP